MSKLKSSGTSRREFAINQVRGVRKRRLLRFHKIVNKGHGQGFRLKRSPQRSPLSPRVGSSEDFPQQLDETRPRPQRVEGGIDAQVDEPVGALLVGLRS